ncbi:MAG TPA: carboxypeptidase-like regulatory domain-containing protein [Thermoleophilaceae bacterium]|nr:carboxypeptidase-like regulatory domain-containing protein [Thermoleophilaceae bacterium]
MPVRGAQFSVSSTATWLLDSGTEFPCSQKGNYMRIRSSVSWPGMGTKPVTVTSLATPSGQAGTASATITDRSLAGMPGIAVTMSGPETKTVTTDAKGCVFFGQMQPGDYTLAFSRSGHIDPTGVGAVSKRVTVNSESSVNETFRYDLPGSITARFNTKRGDALQAPAYAGWALPGASFVSLSHSGLLQGTKPYVVDPIGTSATMTGLFPFTDAYSVYAGDCPGANPSSYTTAPTQPPFAVPNTQTVLPGGSHTVDVRVPAMRLRYRTKATNASDEYWVGVPGQETITSPSSTVVKLTATAPGCGGSTSWHLDDTLWANNSDAGGFIDRPVGRAVAEDWGIPIGTYNLCLDLPNGFDPQGDLPSGNYSATAFSVPVKDPAGETVSFSSLVLGDCP